MFVWSGLCPAVAEFGTANFDSLAMMSNRRTPSLNFFRGTDKRSRVIFGEVPECGDGS